MRVLPRAFYLRDAVSLARGLLGKLLVHHSSDGMTAGIIVETEAYCGRGDPAAHSYRGPPDGRTAVMYGPGGHAYIYLIYGIHCCMNVVAGPADDPQGVLIRALEPTDGLPLMARRRYGAEHPEALTAARLFNLCSGPGKLTQAMGITRAHYGLDVCQPPLAVTLPDALAPLEIDASPRIGVDYAGAAANWPYRFTVRGSPYLSRPPVTSKDARQRLP